MCIGIYIDIHTHTHTPRVGMESRDGGVIKLGYIYIYIYATCGGGVKGWGCDWREREE